MPPWGGGDEHLRAQEKRLLIYRHHRLRPLQGGNPRGGSAPNHPVPGTNENTPSDLLISIDTPLTAALQEVSAVSRIFVEDF